jgi:hypothetical protein
MNPVTGLSLGRIAIGAAALARPDLVARTLGLDPVGQPQAAYMARMFGSREIALGTLTLATRGRGRAGVVLLGVGVDAADAATGYLGPREAQVTQKAGAMLTGPAVLAMLVGVLGLRTRSSAPEVQAAPAGRKARKTAKKTAKKAANKAAKKAARKAA